MARPTHFEHSYEDPAAASRFYGAVFGWTTQTWEGGDQPYWLLTTGPEGEQGINGGFMRTTEGMPRVINTISVDSVDDAIRKVEENGGTVAMPKTEIAGVGYQAYCLDPEGVMFGIHETIAQPEA